MFVYFLFFFLGVVGCKVLRVWRDKKVKGGKKREGKTIGNEESERSGHEHRYRGWGRIRGQEEEGAKEKSCW